MSTPQLTILAVDDEPNMRRLLEISLRQAGYRVLSAGNGREALELIQQQQIDLVVSDLHMSGMNGLQLLGTLRKLHEHLPFIMVTAQGEIKTAVEAMKLGASDYILRPFELETLEVAIEKALTIKRMQQENTFFRETQQPDATGLIGNSPAMQSLKQMIQQVAPERATVFIVGETGTGKELVAKALHEASPRKSALFVAVNCAAIPAEMLESELFGHEKGAFTGAIKERIGKFELANGGTLFLDEITEMPVQLQSKLLRVLQENMVEKLGSNRQIPLDVRVVAATNRDPIQAVKDGRLREDLYYRLNVVQLQIPPLRDRQDDIGLLADFFAGKRQHPLSEEARLCLQQYAWPGNVRELENILERASILAGQQPIQPQHLPADIGQHLSGSATDTAPVTSSNTLSIPRTTEAMEKRLISQALEACQGNKSKAARLLEISERSLWNKLNQYGLR